MKHYRIDNVCLRITMISVSLWYVLDLLIIINKTIITAICCTNVYRI